MLMVGQKAPEFSVTGVVGKGDFKKFALADFRGKWVVLFFYPLDFTTVCPTELVAFHKREGEFRRMNAVLLGASVDSPHAHKAWIASSLGELSFPLLSDLNKDMSRAYNALIEESGHSTRATFMIDPEGILQYALFHNTQVGRSVGETMRVLEAMQTGEKCPVEWTRGEKTLGK